MKGTNLLLNPMQTPDAWRTFLYDQVLLPWETRSFQCRADVYSKSAVEMMLGLLALKKNKLGELQPLQEQLRKYKGEFVAFYCDGKGYEVLFKRLRDSVAHAHYTQGSPGWIKLHHRFQGRGERVPKLRLLGNMKFTTFKRLVAFVNVGHMA